MIDAGPPPLSEAEIKMRLYTLEGLLDDLDADRSDLENIGVLSLLFGTLGDFYLRSKGAWSGSGKALGWLLRANDLAFADGLERAVKDAQASAFEGLRALCEDVLDAYGGRPFDGYRLAASSAWKTVETP